MLVSRKRAHERQRGRERRRLKSEHIGWLNAKFQGVRAQALKLGMIRVWLVEEFPDLAGIWLSTISKCLRSDLGLSYKDLNKRWHPPFAQRLSGRSLRAPTSRSGCGEIRQRLSSSTNSRSTRGSIAWRGGRKGAEKATWRHPKALLAWPSFEPCLNLKFMGS